MKKEFEYLICIFLLTIFFSCNKERIESQEDRIIKYLEKNEITAEPKGSGLYYIENEPEVPISNESLLPKKGDTVVLVYSGYILDNDKNDIVFDERTEDDPGILVYKKDNVIAGWEEGIGYMKEGISAKLIIPYQLAYGKNRVGLIPPYSTLIFDVTVVDIK